MKIRCFVLATLFGLNGYSSVITADTGGPNYELQIGLIESRLKGATLGDDLLLDRLDNSEITIQFDLEYPLDDQFYVFSALNYLTKKKPLKPLTPVPMPRDLSWAAPESAMPGARTLSIS